MAKTRERKVPQCKKCGHLHYNNFGKECPPRPAFISHHPAPEGFKVLSGYGESTLSGGVKGAVVYTLPPRSRSGSLIGPDGNPHNPA